MRAGRSRPAQGGFTFVWVLAAVVIVSIGLSAAGPLWAEQARRDREQALLRVGLQYAQALASYRTMSPGSQKQFPTELEQLLLDRRFAGTVRHLRRLYPDPLDTARPWGLVRLPSGEITGVYSQSSDAPLRIGAVSLPGLLLPAAARYDEWKFVSPVQP